MFGLRLEPDEARALRRELLAVVRRYAGRRGRYVARVMLAPTREEEALP